MLDLAIRGGRVIDGTGNPWFHADVGIRGDRIVTVGPLEEPARRTIEVDGLVVCPGFIDMHTHSDLQPLANPAHEMKLHQGVTLEVVGQDGLGLAPASAEVLATLRASCCAAGTATPRASTGAGARSPSTSPASTAPRPSTSWASSGTARCG